MRGKRHVPTEETKSKVTLLLASGETAEDIAENLGVSIPTFLKHYKDELRSARLNRKTELLRRMEKLSVGEAISEDETGTGEGRKSENAKYIFNATKFFLERFYNREEKSINAGGLSIHIDSQSGDL